MAKARYFIIQLESYCLNIVVPTPEDWSDVHSSYAEVNVKTIETEITEDEEFDGSFIMLRKIVQYQCTTVDNAPCCCRVNPVQWKNKGFIFVYH